MKSRAFRTVMLALALTTPLALPSPLPLLSGGAAWAAPRALASEAPEVAKARHHFKAGEKAFNAGDYARALAEFEAGYLLVPRAGFLLNMAHSERRLGHAARARELYQRYLAADPGSPQREEVLGLIAEVDRALDAQAVPGNGGAGNSAADASPAAAPSPSSGPAASPAPVPAPSSWPGEPEELGTPPPAAAAKEPAAPADPPPAPPPPEEAAPLISTGPPSSAPESQSASRPVYQRWWFWTALGVVAVGVTAGIIVGTRSGGPAFQSDGTLGRVGQP